jgi:hypothetical protein
MSEKSASQQIDDIIKLHGGWKAETLTALRSIITSADPNIVEEVKWKMATRPEGLPVWSLNGIVCFAEIWKDNVKLIFPKGASLEDPHKLFNARLKSATARSIELHEADRIDDTKLTALVHEAITHLGSK